MAKKRTRASSDPAVVTRLTVHGFELPRNDLGVCLANTSELRAEKTAKSSRARLGVIQRPLASYADLVHWMVQVDALTPDGARALLRLADERPDEAADALQRVLDLRQVLVRITAELVRRKWPAPQDFKVITDAVDEFPIPIRLSRASGGAVWVAGRTERDLEWPRRELAYATAVLLYSDARHFVRSCAAANCTVVFVDNSRTHGRRWCNMAACGNVSKMRRRAGSR